MNTIEKKLAQRYFMPVLLFILAYQWIVSSVNKLVVPHYYQGVHTQMSQSLSGIQVRPYANLLKTVGLHHVHLLATLVLLGEMFVGLVFALVGIRKLQGKMGPVESRLGGIAAIIAGFMSLNYALLGGDTVFVDPAHAFQEGISIDWTLFAIEIALAIYFFAYAKYHGVESSEETRTHR